MDRLSIILSLMTGAVITGAIVTTGFALGYYNVWTIVVGAGIGWLLAWPTSYLISRWIKREDEKWNPKADPSDYAPVPKMNAPEV